MRFMLMLCDAQERIMTLDIRHLASAHRFETTVEGYTCELDYTLQDHLMTITHTGVPEEAGGRGIAGELVRAAYEWARQEGWKVVPACSYARVWSQRHPEYVDLHA
jgi:predicted GNAT family acetyltransferase